MNLPASAKPTFLRIVKNSERKENISHGSKHQPRTLQWGSASWLARACTDPCGAWLPCSPYWTCTRTLLIKSGPRLAPLVRAGSVTAVPPDFLRDLISIHVLHCCCSVPQLCPTLCDPMDCSTPGFPVHHQLELTQTQVHRVSDAIQPSHPLSSPSPPTFNLSQNQVAKVLEFQLQHQSLQ